MKKMTRIGGALLALVLLLSMISPSMAVEGESVRLSMTASSNVLTLGEDITVTLRADKSFRTRGAGMTLYYDPAVLEPVLAESTAAAPFAIHGPLELDGKTALRISFMPGANAQTVSGELAKLRFKTLAVTDQTAITLGAAYLYDGLLNEISLEQPEPLQVQVLAKPVYLPVTGIRLDRDTLTLEEGATATLVATVTPSNASNHSVSWKSSDPSIVSVSNGNIQAKQKGVATITATSADGGFTASCTVNVLPHDAGYTVKLPADTGVVIGSSVLVPIVVNNADGKSGYNAFDITVTYDPAVLELVTTKLSGVTVTVSQGTVNILGYGATRAAGSVPITLEFKALQMEKTEISIRDAKVDNSGNAAVMNAPSAILLDAIMSVNVTGYSVTKPDGFTGADIAVPGQDYSFRIPTDSFDYTVIVLVDGKQVKAKDNGDGSYTVPAKAVTGSIQITATKTGKTFRVILGQDMKGQQKAQYGVDYTATLTPDEAYRYQVTVTLGGRDYTGYAIDGNTYRIPGGDITGDIVFTVVKTLVEIPPVTTEPSEPAETTEPTVPSEPGKTTEPTEPSIPDEPTEPNQPSQPEVTITVPVSGKENTVHADVSVAGNKVTLNELDEEEIEQVVGDQVKTGVVEVDLTQLPVEVTQIALPINTLKRIVEAAENAGNDTEALQIDFKHGSVKLDDQTLRTMVEQAGGNEIILVFESVGTQRLNQEQSLAIKSQDVYGGFEAYLFCPVENKRISDFNGGVVTLSTPFEVPADKDGNNFVVWYVADNGRIEELATWYKDGKLYWNVSHFSDFIVVYVENEEDDPDEPNVPTEPTEPGETTEPTQPSIPDETIEPTDPIVPPPPVDPVTYHSVKFTGSGAGAAQGNATAVAHGSNYTFTLKKQSGYSYKVSYAMAGKPAVALSANANGSYTVTNVIAPLEIIIEKTLIIHVSVHPFVTLDKTAAFLVLAEAAVDSETVLTYNGEAMYYSKAYGAWAYLVITDAGMNADIAKTFVKTTNQKKLIHVNSDGDVDQNGYVDWNDVQLAQELYNAKYNDFASISMLKLLNADVNGDKKLDILDAASLVRMILNNEEAGR